MIREKRKPLIIDRPVKVVERNQRDELGLASSENSWIHMGCPLDQSSKIRDFPINLTSV